MPSDKILPIQILLPVLLLSLAILGSFAFQSVILVGDHKALTSAYEQQEKPLQEVEKIRTQVSALATGTLKLAQQGDKNAETIIDQLKKAGIKVVDQPPTAAPVAGAAAPVAAPATPAAP